MGRKHSRKFKRVCESFLELKEVVTRRALRFWSGFYEKATRNPRLKHQGSSIESSKIDPF